MANENLNDATQVLMKSFDNNSNALKTTDAGDLVESDEDSDANYDFYGFAKPGSLATQAVWKIIRINKNGSIGKKYAEGNIGYENIWSARLSLTYK